MNELTVPFLTNDESRRLMLRDGKGNVDSVRLQLNVFFGRPIDSGDDCALAAGRNGVGLNVLNRKRVS